MLDLFSGVGGFSLGLERAGMETVAFCETDPFCQKVLKKHWPGVPIYDDIREFDGSQFRDSIDVVCGGWPCQPASQAGQRRGTDDDRWLWPEMLRLVREVRPEWCIFENVDGLTTLEDGLVFESCLSDLESAGYEVQTFDIPACGVGAIHRRHRIWIVAHAPARRDTESSGNGEQGTTAHRPPMQREAEQRGEPDGAVSGIREAGITTDANGTGLRQEQGRRESRWTGSSELEHDGQEFQPLEWPTEPPVCGADDGVPQRVHRLRALGNAVVPAIPEMIGRAILDTHPP